MARCNSCGGTYPENGPGRVDYFHACPTERIKTHAVCDPATGKVVTPAVFEPLPNPRDENMRLNPDTQKYEITAEGAGVTLLPPRGS